jgi:hypothetical protein
VTAGRWPRYGAAAVGFAWYLFIGGAGTLNPRNIDWLLAGDWRQHWLGAIFFRREPWTWPLGKISALLYPIGTNIGFTDSNPLTAILLKPFSAALPSEFQVIGLWLAVCFTLQGYAGAALASVVTPNRVQQWLGGSLIAMSPVLAGRIGHDTLCAQWIVVMLLYLGLRDTAGVKGRRGIALAAALTILAATIHPYLAAMAYVLALAVFARTWRTRAVTGTIAGAGAFVTTAGVLGMFAVIGYFGDARTASEGFGIYSADLTTLLDPREFSRLLPNLNTPGHWEGLGCLGLGGVIAAGAALVYIARHRPTFQPDRWIMFVACLLLAVYSLSGDVTYRTRPVANLHFIYDYLPFITGPFRSSGRFIWPLHYLAMIAGVWGVVRLFRTRTAATVALGAVVLLEAADYKPARWMLEEKHFQLAPPDLTVAAGRYQHMAVYPAEILGACGGTYEEDRVYRYMLAAYRLKMTFNSGIYSRLPVERAVQLCVDEGHAVDAGQLDRQTLYVVTAWYASQLQKVGAICSRFDGESVCVSRDSDAGFRAYLETGRLPDGK